MDHKNADERRTKIRVSPLDVHVGRRIRSRRLALNMSQVQLAEHLGVTYQQVQKYERGTNRTTAGFLLRVAKALEVDITYFYEGMSFELPNEQPMHLKDENTLLVREFVSSKEGIQLARDFMKIESRLVRKYLIKFLNYLAQIEPHEDQE